MYSPSCTHFPQQTVPLHGYNKERTMPYTRKTVDTWQVLTYSRLTNGWVLDYLYYSPAHAYERYHTLRDQGFQARVSKRRKPITT